MSAIETEILQIVIGVPKLPGDLRSAEQGIQVFPLLINHGSTGFTIKNGQRWQPSRPALKDQWHESGLVDGRSLAGVAVENVRETITLRATADNRLILETRINTLSRFINQARAFFATFYQIEPVYLEWSALGGKGSQYALIYTIDMSVTYDDYGDGEDAEADVQLVIEREPAWRGVPPGASPRYWSLYTQGILPGTDGESYYLYHDTSNPQYAIASGTIENRNEYDIAVDNGKYPSVSQNWLDIPAASIPGDAPALTCITLNDIPDVSYPRHIYVSRITKPLELPDRDTASAGDLGRPLTVNFGYSTGGLGTINNTYGVKSADTADLLVRRITGATSGELGIPPASIYLLNINQMRGKYNVFIRGAFQSGTASITASLSTDFMSTRFPITTDVPIVYPGNAAPKMHWIGQLDIPFHARQVIAPSGTGIYLRLTNTLLVFRVGYTIPAGVTFDFIDLVFVPFDECAGVLDTDVDDVTDNSAVILDNTGYYAHGSREPMVVTQALFATPRLDGFSITGQPIVLEPKVDNRIAFVVDALGDADISRFNFEAIVDIVPRWYGVRDS